MTSAIAAPISNSVVDYICLQNSSKASILMNIGKTPLRLSDGWSL
jgi:hypothetical protein